MNRSHQRKRPLRAALAAAVLLPALLAGCAPSGGSADDAAAAAGASPAPKGDPVAAVRKVAKVAALLPADVRRRGSIRLGRSIGNAPSAYYPQGPDKPPAGVDIDIAAAVAKVLGVRLAPQNAAFETILPALGSGKFDVGTGNFGVTAARLKTVDFATYINDGQGFAVRKGSSDLGKRITELTQLCGRTIGIGAGTTFEATLNAHRKDCAAQHRKPYDAKVYSDNGALATALQQGRVDAVMSTINGLRYQAAQPAARTRFLGEYHRLDVGFAFRKGSPLARPFQAAVNELIHDGTYRRILHRWGTTGSAIPASRINPPEHP